MLEKKQNKRSPIAPATPAPNPFLENIHQLNFKYRTGHQWVMQHIREQSLSPCCGNKALLSWTNQQQEDDHLAQHHEIT